MSSGLAGRSGSRSIRRTTYGRSEGALYGREMSGRIFGPCPFTARELDGRTVEYEGPDYSIVRGILSAEQDSQGQVCVEIQSPGAATPPPPVTCDTAFLRRHPKPRRKVDFLWAKHPVRVLSTMGR